MQPSRQVTRQQARQNAKIERAQERDAARIKARRDRLVRQKMRAATDFYSNRPVALDIAPSRSRLDKRKVQKGKLHGRILKTVERLGRERQLHTTKGWRSYRAA